MIDYCKLTSDLTVKIRTGDVMRHGNGSILRLDRRPRRHRAEHRRPADGSSASQPYLGNSTFMMTYGDGVCDVNVKDLLAFHKKHRKIATLTAVRPPARFGHMHFEGDLITQFTEKPQTEAGWINGGFFVLEPKIFDFIDGDDTWFEREPLESWPPRSSSSRTSTRTSGSAWTRCATSACSKSIWTKGKAPWKTP